MPNDITAKIEKARAAGYSDAQIRDIMQKKGYDTSLLTPPVQKPLIERAGEFVSKHNLPGSKIGENIGTTFAAFNAARKGNLEGARAISQTAPTGKQIVGDVARSVALPVSIGAPNPATLGGTVAQFGAMGAVSGAAEAATRNASQAEIIQEGGKGAAIGAAAGMFSRLIQKGVEKFGQLTGKTGEKIVNTVIKPTKPDLDDGFSMETVKKYNLAGSLKQMQAKTETLMDDLTRQLNDKYATTPARLNINDVLNKTIEKAAGSKVNSFGSNTSMETAFNQLKGEIAAITADGNVSIPEAVQIKRAAGHYGAWLYGAPDPEATARQKVYNAFYNQLKTAIEQNSPEGVKQINKQLSELIPVMNSIIRRIPVAERNATLSLTDIISLSASAMDPRSLSVFALNQLSKSGVVGRELMQAGPAIQSRAGALAKPIRTAATALPAALQSATSPEQVSPGQLTNPSPDTTTPSTRVNDDGSITTTGPFSGKEFNIDPNAVGGTIRKGTLEAADFLKDYLIAELRNPSFKAAMNADNKLLEEGEEFAKFLMTHRGKLSMSDMNRGLEILRLQGVNVNKALDRIIADAESSVKQLRDTLGRFTDKFE